MAIARVTPTEAARRQVLRVGQRREERSRRARRHERRGARLLHRHVGAEHGRVARARDAENLPLRVDHRDGHARRRAERPANLRARAIRDVERRLQDRAHLRVSTARQRRAVRAGARRIAQYVRRVDEHERVAPGEVDVAIGANARCRLAERRARADHAVEVTRHGYQAPTDPASDRERRRGRGIAAQLIEVDVAEAERLAVRRDPVAAPIDRRGKPNVAA